MSVNLGYRAADPSSFANIDSEIPKKPTTFSSSEIFQFNFQEHLIKIEENSSENVSNENVLQSCQASKQEDTAPVQPKEYYVKSSKSSDFPKTTAEDRELESTGDEDQINDEAYEDDIGNQASPSSVILHYESFSGEDDSREISSLNIKEQAEISTGSSDNTNETLEALQDSLEQEFTPTCDLESAASESEMITVTDLEGQRSSTTDSLESFDDNKEVYNLSETSPVEKDLSSSEAKETAVSPPTLDKDINPDKPKGLSSNKDINPDKPFSNDKGDLDSTLEITVNRITKTTEPAIDSEIPTAETSDENFMQENSEKNFSDLNKLKSLENEDTLYSDENDTGILPKNSFTTQVTEESLFVEEFTNAMLSKVQTTIDNMPSNKITELTIKNEGIKFTVTIESSKGLLSKVNITSDDPTSIKLLMRGELKLEQALQKIQGAENCSLTFDQNQRHDGQNQQALKQELQNLKFIQSQGSEASTTIYDNNFAIRNKELEGQVDIFC